MATLQQVYFENFESGNGGFAADNTGGSVLGLWHYSVGRRNDNLPNHSPTHNWYYGMFETATGGGRFDVLPFDHQGTLTSPPIQLPDCGAVTLNFSYVLDTRPELDRDFVTVYVLTASGATPILARQDGTLPETGNQWLTATADLSAFGGQAIQLVYEFRTGIAPNVDPEGWYVDDILITSQCDDGPVLTADLAVQKTASDLTPDELQTITYTLVASNSVASTAAATGVVVTDNLPAGVTFVSAVASEGSYDTGADAWTGINLAPGESQTLTITVTVNAGTAGQTLVNTAGVTGDQPDPEPANNQSTVQVIVNPAPASVDLSVSKTVDDPSPSEGQLITYLITVASAATSSGPSGNITVADNMPAGVTFVSAVASEGTYDPGTDTWSGIVLAAGESETLAIQVVINAGTAGQALANTAIVTGPDADPDPSNNESTVVLAVDSVVQFIAPLSLYRPAGPFPPPAPAAANPPAAGMATIKGFKWHDLDQDGVWDAGEPGRAGWGIYLDLNGDNVFDPLTEPFAVTATDGSYVFADLAPGTYFIREDNAGLSDGMFSVQRFPAADPGGLRDADEHRVVLAANQLLVGQFGVAEVPNFGSFDYSPLIRPADDFPGHFAVQSASQREAYLSATLPWQSFNVHNSTGRPLQITQINKLIDTSLAPASQFVQILRRAAGGAMVPVSLPMAVLDGQSAEFFAFYDPAIRSGDLVTAQYPDWFDDPATAGTNEALTRPPHTFAATDRLEVVTEYTDVAEPGPTFTASLVGASTYDSDIFYDGAVENADVARLADLLAANAFDQTSDMNVRLPNGASSTVGTQAWPINGPPPREIGLGDFAPLNMEFGRTRAPFLDLDTDNSTSRGVEFAAELVAGSAPVADSDARFANRLPLQLASLTLVVTNPLDGAAEDFDFSGLPAGITGSSQFAGGVRTLTLTGNVSVETYALALRGITYTNSAASPTAGTRLIAIEALGGSDFDSPLGNLAVARITVKPAPALAPQAEAQQGEGEASWLAPAATSASPLPVIGPLQPEEFALLTSRADFSWSSLTTCNLWASPRAECVSAAAALLAAISDEERAAIEQLLAHWSEDALDLGPPAE